MFISKHYYSKGRTGNSNLGQYQGPKVKVLTQNLFKPMTDNVPQGLTSQ